MSEVETKSFSPNEISGLDDINQTQTIDVECGQEKKLFRIDRHYVSISKHCVRTLEQDPNSTVIPCPTVKPEVFAEILNYMEHHKGVDPPIIEYPAKSVNMSENCTDPWDADFVDNLFKKSKRLFYDVLNAANFLEVVSLVHLCCCKIATCVMNCPLDNVSAILVPEDVSK